MKLTNGGTNNNSSFASVCSAAGFFGYCYFYCFAGKKE